MKVRFTNQDLHRSFPQIYPKPGTVGEVISKKTGYIKPGVTMLRVRWPEGTVIDIAGVEDSIRCVGEIFCEEVES